MTPHNTTQPAVDYDNFWPSYRHHLRREISQISVGDLAGTAGVVAATGWLAYLAYQDNHFTGAMAVGAMALFLAHSLWSVLADAAMATVAARPWYGIGRTVHHIEAGFCEVVDVDERPELVEETWVLIRPFQRTEDTPARWVLFEQVTAPATDLRER